MSIRAVLPGLPLAVLLAAGAAHGQEGGVNVGPAAAPDADAMARYEARTRVIRPCPQAAPGEVVVCARPEDSRTRYRLPLVEEQDSAGRGPVPGESPRASAEPVRAGSCGVVGGQPYGCTGGVPIVGAAMMAGQIIMGLIDADGDHEPPPAMPERFMGVGER